MTRKVQYSGFCALVRAVALALCLATPALSGPFSPVKIVNGLAITQYELDQRMKFMELLRQPGDLQAQAMAGLIDDRIRLSLARQYDVTLPDESVRAGMTEFASQANMDADQFIEAIGKAGVDAETFRDFVYSGMLWREVARAKLGPAIVISEADIDRALAGAAPLTAIQVRLAEIVLPATGAARGPALALAHHLELELRAGGDFAALARAHSAGTSAGRGGALDWMLLSQMKPDAAVAVRALKVGEYSDPVVLDDTVVIYQMQEFKQDKLPPAGKKVVDYAEFLIPDAAGEIAKLRNGADDCDDLYTLAKGLPAGQFQRQTVAISQLPRDIAAALVLLDPGESSVALTRGGWRVFLMLCRRGEPETSQPTRDEVRLQLSNQRLGVKAEILMEQLRSEAVIADP